MLAVTSVPTSPVVRPESGRRLTSGAAIDKALIPPAQHRHATERRQVLELTVRIPALPTSRTYRSVGRRVPGIPFFREGVSVSCAC
jgi:hypothetical protein